MADKAKMESRLQQLSVAIEQHHQAYLGQQPLVLMALPDYEEFVEYHKEHVDGVEPTQVFGAQIRVMEKLEAGNFLVAKLVHYV